MIRAIARIFYRMVGVHAIPVGLGLRNIYILPTGYGMLFLVLLATMLIGSINYNNNLGFLLTFLLGSIMLSTLMHTYGMLHGLRLVAATTTPAFAGEPAIINITVEGAGRMRKGLRWYCSKQNTVLGNVRPEGQTVIAVAVPTARRGLFSPEPLHILTEYPTGLFRAWSRIETRQEYLVYPKPVFAPLTEVKSPPAGDEGEAVAVAGVDDFEGLKTYQAGDPPGRIHWPSYSRGQGLHVKTFAGRVSGERVLDFNAIQGGDIERKLSILCYHLVEGERRHQSLGLQLPGHPLIPPGKGQAHRERCLRALALYSMR